MYVGPWQEYRVMKAMAEQNRQLKEAQMRAHNAQYSGVRHGGDPTGDLMETGRSSMASHSVAGSAQTQQYQHPSAHNSYANLNNTNNGGRIHSSGGLNASRTNKPFLNSTNSNAGNNKGRRGAQPAKGNAKSSKKDDNAKLTAEEVAERQRRREALARMYANEHPTDGEFERIPSPNTTMRERQQQQQASSPKQSPSDLLGGSQKPPVAVPHLPAGFKDEAGVFGSLVMGGEAQQQQPQQAAVAKKQVHLPSPTVKRQPQPQTDNASSSSPMQLRQPHATAQDQQQRVHQSRLTQMYQSSVAQLSQQQPQSKITTALNQRNDDTNKKPKPLEPTMINQSIIGKLQQQQQPSSTTQKGQLPWDSTGGGGGIPSPTATTGGTLRPGSGHRSVAQNQRNFDVGGAMRLPAQPLVATVAAQSVADMVQGVSASTHSTLPPQHPTTSSTTLASTTQLSNGLLISPTRSRRPGSRGSVDVAGKSPAPGGISPRPTSRPSRLHSPGGMSSVGDRTHGSQDVGELLAWARTLGEQPPDMLALFGDAPLAHVPV